MNDTKVVTRFAPSPTGSLHIGSARTALLNWAFARRLGGKFLLRIEDTDKARSTDAATRGILEDLKWLGIIWDEGPGLNPPAGDVKAGQIGERGPYFQSQRDEIYKGYLRKLIDMGRAYPDGDAYRFKMPKTAITVDDLVLGAVTIQAENLEDFIIFKGAAGGGGPTFHFANVVDDAEMGVTHVLRAQEHLMNTPKHVAMFDALGIGRPKYAHMPLIFNPDGSKMSKRDKAKAARKAAGEWVKQKNGDAKGLWEYVGEVFKTRSTQGSPEGQSLGLEDVQGFLEKKTDANEIAVPIARALGVTLPEIDVNDFRQSGYLQEVLLNYVALLGWSPGNNVERFDLEYLKREFDLERLGKSNAKFDRAKLLAFNAETIQKLPAEVFAEKLRGHLAAYHPTELAKLGGNFGAFCGAYQLRSRTLSEPMQLGRFFFVEDEQIQFDAKAVEKVLKKDGGKGLAVLREILPELKAAARWEAGELHQLIERVAGGGSSEGGDLRSPAKQEGLHPHPALSLREGEGTAARGAPGGSGGASGGSGGASGGSGGASGGGGGGGRGLGDIAQPLRVAMTGTTVSPAIHDTLAILGKEATIKRIERCLSMIAEA